MYIHTYIDVHAYAYAKDIAKEHEVYEIKDGAGNTSVQLSRYECICPLKYHPVESLNNKQLVIFICYLTPRVAVSVTKLTLSVQSNPIPLEDASRDVHLR